ncbi:MAG: hypothetical protein HGA47_14135, partial [Zoogloea sp.]|nr:hypothetical protein [Zoogloea sp.]
LLGALPGWMLQVAAGTALAATLAFIAWQVKRARATLGRPHPGWRWYPAALACLALALAAILAGLAWPPGYRLARLAHLHLNTLGFVGLAAIGTLNVLLPTVLNRPDARAAGRLQRALPFALAGVLLVAASGLSHAVAIAGGVLLAGMAAHLWLGWMRGFGLAAMMRDGASASLLGALTGFVVLLAAGAAQGLGLMPSRALVPAFIILFLLPLVTGALSQLVPVWRLPGALTPARQALRTRLARGGGVRAALFLAGGCDLLAGWPSGYALALAGILLFAVELLSGLLRQTHS